ncbi:hypothetical protein [Photobacterium nomapromontoriensis]|uniref:hypothetical protein n=1 Tax=Photobacterium nomapromontoriensis TaxID=2910237 RepID=UPI003D12F757
MLAPYIPVLFLLGGSLAPFSDAQSQPLTVEFAPISAEQYQTLVKSSPANPQPPLVEIKDKETAYDLLGVQLKIIREPINDSEWEKITLYLYDTKGEEIYQYDYFDECEFVAFYPQEQRIGYTCGHGQDWLISTQTGQLVDENPEYRITAPNGQRRLSGYYNGQEFAAFLQQNMAGKWKTPEVTLRLAEGREWKDALEPYRAEWVLSSMHKARWLSNDRWVFYNYNYNGYFEMQVVSNDVSEK